MPPIFESMTPTLRTHAALALAFAGSALAGDTCVPETLVSVAGSTVVGGTPYFVDTADFNNDSIPDLVVANTTGDSAPFGGVAVLLGLGDGDFSAPTTVYSATQVLGVVSEDLDNDGNDDIAVASFSSGVAVLFGRADATFETPTFLPTDTALDLKAADFNTDGDLDLVVLESAPGNNGDRSFRFFEGAPDRTFVHTASVPINSGIPALPEIAEINGDAIPDVVFVSLLTDELGVLRSNSLFYSFTPVYFETNFNFIGDVAAADLTDDARTEIVVTGESAINGPSLMVFDPVATGALAPRPITQNGSGPFATLLTDMDNDGNPDLVSRWGNLITPNQRRDVTIARGDGAGGFLPALAIPVGADSGAHAAADFDADGRTDLAAVDQNAGAVIVLLSRCPAPCYDLTGDDLVNGTDLAVLLAAWGSGDVDFNDDNDTDSLDLAQILAAWGDCP